MGRKGTLISPSKWLWCKVRTQTSQAIWTALPRLHSFSCLPQSNFQKTILWSKVAQMPDTWQAHHETLAAISNRAMERQNMQLRLNKDILQVMARKSESHHRLTQARCLETTHRSSFRAALWTQVKMHQISSCMEPITTKSCRATSVRCDSTQCHHFWIRVMLTF